MLHARSHIHLAALACAVMCPLDAHAQVDFTEVARTVGIDLVTHRGPAFPEIVFGAVPHENMGHGAAVGDFDDDGDLDVYVLQGRGFANRLYANQHAQGHDAFFDVTDHVGAPVGDLGSSRVAHFADLDDDGDLDLLLVNDQNESLSYPPSRIFANRGDGTFVDATAGSNFAPTNWLVGGCSLADFDRDGLLDVWVTAWTHELGVGPRPTQFAGQNRLYRNLGDLRFEDVTEFVGLVAANPRGSPIGPMRVDSFTSTFTDLTDDGWPDLFVAVDHGPDEFFVNVAGNFVRTTIPAGMTHVGNDMGIACADLDDDRDLDLYVTNITDDAIEPCGVGTNQFNALHLAGLNPDGTRRFFDRVRGSGLEDTYWGWGVEFVDVDNDADLDVFAVTGFDELLLRALPACSLIDTPNVLFVNDGSTTFTRVDPPGLAPFTDDSRGLVAFDYDRDGDLDFLVTNVAEPVRLFRNDTVRAPGAGHWLDISVEQRNGNRHGIGTRIDVRTADGRVQRRVVLAGESYLVGTPATAHFGLGTATTASYVRVHWEDGTATTHLEVRADRRMRIRQPRYVCEWFADRRINLWDVVGFAFAWLRDDPRADLDGDETGHDLGDVALFLECWQSNRGRRW